MALMKTSNVGEEGKADTDVMERMVNFSGNQKLNQIKVKPNRNELKHEK